MQCSSHTEGVGELQVALLISTPRHHDIPSGRQRECPDERLQPLAFPLASDKGGNEPIVGNLKPLTKRPRLLRAPPRGEGLCVHSVGYADYAVGELWIVHAHLLSYTFGYSHERGRAVVGKAQPLGDPDQASRQNGVYAEKPAGATRSDLSSLVAVVNGNDVNPVQHDRTGRLDDAPTPFAQRERAGDHEPRIGEQERAARTSYAVKSNSGGRWQHAGASDYRDPIAEPLKSEYQFCQLMLHSPH